MSMYVRQPANQQDNFTFIPAQPNVPPWGIVPPVCIEPKPLIVLDSQLFQAMWEVAFGGIADANSTMQTL